MTITRESIKNHFAISDITMKIMRERYENGLPQISVEEMIDSCKTTITDSEADLWLGKSGEDNQS